MPAFPFLKLPAELRTQVYRYLLHALHDICIDSSEAAKERFWRRAGREPSKIWKTSRKNRYRVTAIGLHPAILSVNWQTYLEATRILYSENRFSFRSDDDFCSVTTIDAVIPFLEDRCEGSRRLIREIEYFYTVISSLRVDLEVARVFTKTCDYLSQNLQLQHVTLSLVAMFPQRTFSGAVCRMYPANLDKHGWVQGLVPLAQKLKTLTLIGKDDGDAELVHAAQTYLESKMAEASNTPCQSQITQLGSGSAA